MKVKKIIAAVSCAALITAAALPLTACGGKEETATLDISKYAATVDQLEELSSETYDFDKRPEATLLGKFNDITNPTIYTGSTYMPIKIYAIGETVTAENESIYTVYNTKTGKELVKDLKDAPTVDEYSINAGYYYLNYDILVTSTTTGDTDPVTTYDYIGEDGTVLLDDVKVTDPTLETIKRYVGADTEESDILSIKYIDANDAEQEKYYKIEDSASGLTYTSVEKSAIKASAPEYAAGSAAFGVAKKIYADPNYPVTGGMEEYSYAKVGNEMVFYKGTSETGRVSLDNVKNLKTDLGSGDKIEAFVDNYYYYAVQVRLDKENKKPDITIIDEGIPEKYTYEVHRYDIVGAKDEVIEKDYYIESINPFYNRADKKYDAAVVTGKKIVDGVVQRNTFDYATDTQLKKAYDVSGISNQIGGLAGFISLGNDKYAVMGYSGEAVVTDKDMNPISKFDGFDYYAKEGVFMFEIGSNFGLADIDGKVIAEPQYELLMPVDYSDPTLTFYGGKAFVKNAATGKYVILGADGSETALELDGHMQDLSGYDMETYTGTIKDYSLAQEYGVYYVGTATKEGESGPIKTAITIYNLDGSAILSFNDGMFNPISGIMNNCFKITFTEDGNPVQYLYSIA